MSLTKARDLLRLAEMAAARHGGVTLSEIAETFAADHRTAQRMTRALEEVFPEVEVTSGEDRRRRWKLRDAGLARMQGLRDSELAALEMSIRRAGREGAADDVRALTALRDRLLACMPGPHARRAEADAETLLEAQGYALRPGPRVPADLRLLDTLSESLRGPFCLDILYAGPRDPAPRWRHIHPHGILLGTRRYLVAREPAVGPAMRHFRMDRIADARVTGDSFTRQPDFDIARHAGRAFGSFHDDREHAETVWRFAPRAAAVARGFVFHPDQTLTEEEDGSLTLRFHAGGWLEMVWHLYQWGDAVTVLAPPQLAAMVAGHRRGDFAALP